MNHLARAITLALIALPLTAGCDASEASTGADAPTGPCAGAAALAGVVVLEVDDSPADQKEGVKFVKSLENELAAECVAKGHDKSATEALACYEKNKTRPGYRVWKGCDDKVGKELVAAVVAKHKK